MEKAQGFEITEYSDEHELPDHVRSCIMQVVSDRVRDNPAVNIRVTFTGTLMKVTYHSYEMMLNDHQRMQEVDRFSKKALDEVVKDMKSEVKKRIGETIKISEKKEMANFSVERVNLNQRFMFASWRFYELE
jgi:uncharacterized membrane-anchored protein YjiN (DUF445 family)